MRVAPSHTPYISSGIQQALANFKDPFNTGGLENISKEDVARHANVRFLLNYCVPTFEVAQQAKGEIYGGWKVQNKAIEAKHFPFIKLTRSPAKEEAESVGDKFHISVNPKDVPKAFEIISKLINSESSPINSWKATDTDRADPRNTRLTHGAQFTLYPKPDRADGTYSPEYMGKIQALVKAIEHALQEAGIGHSEHKPASDVSAPQWGYVSYRNEIRSDREGSASQTASLLQEPFFKLTAGID